VRAVPAGRRAPRAAPAVRCLAVLLGGLAAATASFAEEPAQDEGVSLDRLLKLPDGFGTESERRAGATASEWRSRFEATERAVTDARDALARAQAELEAAAGESGDWQLTPPGASGPPRTDESTVSFRLRQEVRRRREQLEQAERSSRQLEIEADLAGVPEDWRLPPSVSSRDAE
jgi:hypothetical protein